MLAEELNKDWTAEDISELSELGDLEQVDIPPTYEVWLYGRDENNFMTDFEYLIELGYDSPVEAKKCFDFFSVEENLKLLDQLEIPEEVKHLYISVEAVVDNEDISEAIETLYETEIILKK